MHAFPVEVRTEGTLVPDAVHWDNTVDPALTVPYALRFNHAELNQIGSGWATWSHGYTGAAYFTEGTDQYLVFPEQIQAFYMYVQPNLFGTFEFMFTSEGVTKNVVIEGNSGAQYVGIYTNGPLYQDPVTGLYDPEYLSGISIKQLGGADGFAIGEFASNIPEPTTWTLAALGLCGAFARRRRI